MRAHALARYWRGRWWLSAGFCPACNSSPPLPDCPVCHGDCRYGPEAGPAKRAAWRATWDAHHHRGGRP